MSNSVWKSFIPFSVSILSLVISVMVWWQAVEQTRLQALNYEKSTEPHITIVPTIDPEKGYKGFYLFNGGAGTGYVESIEIRINDEIISDEYFDNTGKHGLFHVLADRLRVINSNGCFKYGIPRKGDPVTLNEMMPLWAVSGEKLDCVAEHFQLYDVLLSHYTNFDIILTYKSIYGVTYQYSSRSNLKIRL
ncbi:hypothetical protein KKJ01_04860 [Xenorhabdus bovienii]|uniref:Uncharacterized protein n=1 Tax=Xenorhabdus bovienii TaxID=40576 RepID=A0AAJ1J5D0_XENBV|nr:hypothetical protein [Xenorhabdus bovienii]MDE1477587.1 hypothetical protein [Xenorhabdus bovienii]MDE9509328.1 hypothetical protein [Xenorhabdus bovienii]MDE9520973.1 hypothetical protein [Xenorhabdus bovienii]